jgi:hypothetical protein
MLYSCISYIVKSCISCCRYLIFRSAAGAASWLRCDALRAVIWLQLQADALHGMRCVLFALHGVR